MAMKASMACNARSISICHSNPTFPTEAKKPGISRGHPQKFPLQGGCGGLNDLACCGDPRSRLDGQVEVELLHEELLIGIEFRVALRISVRPSVVGKWTSSIWIAA